MSTLILFQQNITFHFMKITQIKTILSSIAIAVVALSTIAPGAYAASGAIVGVLGSKTPQFTTLVAALTAADLVTTLEGTGPFTLFAPTNEAFAALPADVLAKLLLPINKAELQKVLNFHVLAGKKTAADLEVVAATATNNRLPTVEGSQIPFSGAGATFKVNVTTSVTAADIPATNGIIHQVDKVLFPPRFVAADLKSDSIPAVNNIVQAASGTPDVSTLVAAINAAGLDNTLTAAGPYTVLAPTNAAFAKIPADVLAKLLLPENKAALVKILTYHVIAGSYDSVAIPKLTTIKTLEGSNLSIKLNINAINFNNTSEVVVADIKTSNGIIHTIDTVLIPSSVDLSKLVGKATVRTGGQTQTIAAISILCIIALGLVNKFRTSK
jgi:transforming growth factor-beta-induced protein